MKKRNIIFIFLLSVGFSQSWNTTLIGQLDYPQFVNDVWGYKADNGKEYALVGTSLGVSIVDVNTNPFQPEQVGFISGDESIWRDIKVYNNHMYISTEANMGIQVADISDPENPELVFEWDGISGAHNLFQADGYLYVVGADGGDHIDILDLSNPAEPVKVGGWSSEYIHDVYVRDNYAYACGYYSSTMYIIDVSDKTNPFTEVSWTYPGAAHATWLTEDGNYLITADETSGGNIKIWDIQDFDNINMVSEWIPEGGEDKSAHNVFVRGDYLYISYYVFGLQILDISDPTNPELAGYYDTYPGEEGIYEGNWGVYPFAESCYSYVSDMEAGLVLVDFDECINPDPDLIFSPESINLSIEQGDTITEDLTLSNVGDEGSTLFYRIEPQGISPFENPGGGPDGYGYEWSDSDLEPGLFYNWINIEGHFNTEEVHFLTNDDAATPVELPFEFPFYGNSYSHFIVNPNGWVGFGNDNDEWDNFIIPSPDAPRPSILALWNDLNPENENCNEYCSGNVYVKLDVNYAVIWYDDVAKWYSGDVEAFFDFQIVLYSTGKIRVNYRTINGTPSATIGIQNQDGTDGLLVNFLMDYAHDLLTLEYFTGETPTWITFDEGGDEGQVLSGESENVIIQIDTGILEPGEYLTDLKILNNALPSVTVPLNVEVLNPDAEITMSIPYAGDWNMVGLPVIVSNSHYQSVFPSSIQNSCFGFIEEYIQVEELELGNGYWLRFSDAGTTDLTGFTIDELEVEISADWNIISGISDVVNVNEGIYDPAGILIPGTFYGFDGNYQNSNVLEPGKGYWVRAMADGEIIISSSTLSTTKVVVEEPENANTLTFGNQTLYFGIDIPDKEMLSYSLPPKPPTGAMDVRFSGDTKLCASDECVIEVMNDGSPLTFECDIKDSEVWELVDESGKVYRCSGLQLLEFEKESETYVLRKSPSPQTPTEFALLPAYPNPFNPVTTIQFSIPELSEVKMSVYDIQGRMVETLLDENLSPGDHSFQWYAEGFPSGVYFLKLKSDRVSLTEKLILMK
ncbi:MAG: choice-of-anchor B family protein [Candidatus Marinimicrobia bacterium]|nr:choice-of-anchor B family protein [Candidatus Neomarinimicrobiota bacterium]